VNCGELIAILAGVVFTALLGLWCGLSAIWAKRRIPPRLTIVGEISPGVAIPVNGDPREIRVRRSAPQPFRLFDWPVRGLKPFDWKRDLHTPDWSWQRV